jgi:hypothetical protein
MYLDIKLRVKEKYFFSDIEATSPKEYINEMSTVMLQDHIKFLQNMEPNISSVTSFLNFKFKKKHYSFPSGFDGGKSRIPDFDYGLTASVTGQQRMLTPSAAPDPTFAFVGGPCCSAFDFVFAFWIMTTFYTMLISLFCIP